MVKYPLKLLINENNPLNHPNQPSRLDSLLSKKRDRKEYSKQRYQAKKQEYHQWYLQRKAQQEKQEKEQLNKYYGASAIKVLMSLKEYTELNQEKRKIWLNFVWIFKDLVSDNRQPRINNIIEIMKLREEADKLISDYWTTAQKETRKVKNWSSLTDEEKQRLVKYWGQEKVRNEVGLNQALEQQAKSGQNFEKEIKRLVDISVLHEERGKVKCKCWKCEEAKQKEREKKAELEQLFKEDEEKQSKERVECPDCGRKVKELDEESGVCKKCMKNYE